MTFLGINVLKNFPSNLKYSPRSSLIFYDKMWQTQTIGNFIINMHIGDGFKNNNGIFMKGPPTTSTWNKMMYAP